MKIAVIEWGPVSLELLEETGPDGVLSGPVEERGDFIHHLSLITDAMDDDIAELESKGVQMGQDKPYIGLRGKRISFITSGILGEIPVELTEP
jgi:methylmalonyl-CoA/ethylmalonyl-CoA epimerase